LKVKAILQLIYTFYYKRALRLKEVVVLTPIYNYLIIMRKRNNVTIEPINVHLRKNQSYR